MSIAVATTKLIVEHLQSIVPEAECNRRAYHGSNFGSRNERNRS